MSLTAKVYGARSPISNWFDERHTKGIDNLISKANQHLNGHPVVDGYHPSKPRGLIKAAAVYTLLKHIGYLNEDTNWFANTHASEYLSKVPKKQDTFNNWITGKTKSIEEKAIACVVAAALDISYRARRDHDFLKQLTTAFETLGDQYIRCKKFKQWVPSILETSIIASHIARCHSWDKNYKAIPSPTFDLSTQIGGAEADLIINEQIISVVTGTQFTHANLRELIAYTLLDTNNTYSIQKLVWIFPLRQTSVCLSISKLFKNISESRADFKKFIDAEYPLDEFNTRSDGIDILKYCSGQYE